MAMLAIGTRSFVLGIYLGENLKSNPGWGKGGLLPICPQKKNDLDVKF